MRRMGTFPFRGGPLDGQSVTVSKESDPIQCAGEFVYDEAALCYVFRRSVAHSTCAGIALAAMNDYHYMLFPGGIPWSEPL